MSNIQRSVLQLLLHILRKHAGSVCQHDTQLLHTKLKYFSVNNSPEPLYQVG